MNPLQTEKSPYLLQHIDNPVEWYPWVGPAFERDPGQITKLAGYTRDMTTVDDQAAAYVCQKFSCMAPVTAVDELSKILDSGP